MGKSMKRFSYLLLEEGEFYVQDWMAVCRSGLLAQMDLEPQMSQHRRFKGRLRLCSKSIFFEPEDFSLPIIMLPFNKVKRIEGGPQSLTSPSPANSKWSRQQEGFVVETSLFVKMKAGGLDLPYAFMKQESKWWFSLEFASVQQFLLQAQSFLSINRLPAFERDMVLSNSMAQKEAQGRFDTTRLSDLNEQILFDFPAAQVTPLVREPGRLVLTQAYLYFQPLHNLNNDSPVRAQPLRTIITIARRRHALRHIGLELFFTELDLLSKSIFGSGLSNGGSAFFTFRTVEERDEASVEILKQIEGLANKEVGVGCLLEADSPWLESIMRAWQEGKVSNFDYLLYLNLAAGRSFCDLTQWPVMPWVLSNYTSAVLDLSNPMVFRDLSKPIGALNVDRLSIFKERYAQMVEEGVPDHPFLYGTHYSTPGYVLYWLVRLAPAHMLRLQNGRFDAPDRLFVSLRDSWDSVNNNPADLKELIPEFFTHSGEFLLKREGLNLGVRQGGDVVSDVELPPWCKSPDDFIKKHQEALECEHVSKTLHTWIDLIFGFKQCGEAALAADNVFHHLTYEGAVDLETVVDPVERASLEAQINEFGQAPQQLFSKPHPERLVGQSMSSDQEAITENLHREVFRGLNPQFLSRIMAVAAHQSDSLIGHVLSPDLPNCRADLPSDSVGTFLKASCDPETSFETLAGEIHVENEKSARISDARTTKGERFTRMTGIMSDGVVWDNWSPASNYRMEYKDNDPERSREAFQLQEGVQESKVWARRLATGQMPTMLESVFTGESTSHDVSEARTGRDLISPYSLMFKEQLSSSQSLTLHRGPVMAVALSEDNASEALTLYSAGQDGFVKVYSLRENCQLRAARLGSLPLSALALLKNNKNYPILLAGSNDNCLYSYSVGYDRLLGKMQVHEDTVTCIRSIDELQRLITASYDATIKIWTLEEGRSGCLTGFNLNSTSRDRACIPEDQFLEHEGAVLSLDVQENGYLVVSGEEDGSVVAWDLRNPGAGVWQQRGVLQGPIVGVQFITNGSHLAVASGEGTVHLLDARKTGSCVVTYNCERALTCLEASENNILAGSVSGDVFIFHTDAHNRGDTEDVQLLGGASLQDHEEAVNSISMFRDPTGSSCTVAMGASDGCIHLYTS